MGQTEYSYSLFISISHISSTCPSMIKWYGIRYPHMNPMIPSSDPSLASCEICHLYLICHDFSTYKPSLLDLPSLCVVNYWRVNQRGYKLYYIYLLLILLYLTSVCQSISHPIHWSIHPSMHASIPTYVYTSHEIPSMMISHEILACLIMSWFVHN